MAAPLPNPLPGLANSRYKVKFHRGQLCMFAGAPGAGKTTMALIMAIRCGARALYFSADSDEATMSARAASALTGHTYGEVRETQNMGAFDLVYGDILNSLPIRFVFDPSEPSLEDIANGVTAYAEVWGQPPELIIIDNLMNCKNDDTGNEWQGMKQIVKSLHWLARKTKSCIWLLHHTSEGSDSWITGAPPRSAIQGKMAQLPEIILTFANQEGMLYVGVVKNRHGESDPLAKQPIAMIIDFAKNQLHDVPMRERERGFIGEAG